MNTLDGLLYFKIVLIVKFAMPYWVARSDTQIPLSYFAIISFLNSLIVRTTLLFTLLLSLTLLGHMVTYCTYLISGNKSKKKKIFTAQFPQMLTTQGVVVNRFILVHSVLRHLRAM